MPAEPTVITLRNQEAEELISAVAEIAERTRRMEAELHGLLDAFRSGGIKGLRNFASRPDRDGSRAQFMSDGLANLGTWAKERQATDG
jgi:hypothetical protein